MIDDSRRCPFSSGGLRPPSRNGLIHQLSGRYPRARPLHARCAFGGKRASNSEVSQRAAGGAGMLFQHIAWSQSALMRCRARCACSAYATSSEFDAFLPFWLPSAARKGGRCLRRRLGEGFSGRCPSDGWSGLLSRRFPGMRGAFFAALSVSSRQSKKMTCGITKKYPQNSIMTSKNYPMTIIDCHRIISYSGRSGIWPILTRNGGILV